MNLLFGATFGSSIWYEPSDNVQEGRSSRPRLAVQLQKDTQEGYRPSPKPYRLRSRFLNGDSNPRDRRRAESKFSAECIPVEAPLLRQEAPSNSVHSLNARRRRRISQQREWASRSTVITTRSSKCNILYITIENAD